MRTSTPTFINPRLIELFIDELVLHGFPAGDRYRIAEAVQSELSQLIADQIAGQGVSSLFTQNAEQPQIDAGSFNVAPGSSADSVGGQIGIAVHRGLFK